LHGSSEAEAPPAQESLADDDVDISKEDMNPFVWMSGDVEDLFVSAMIRHARKRLELT
jgi:hypothetical protein